MYYNSILIEGEQEEIDKVSALIDSDILIDVLPSKKISWKKADFGLVEVQNFYINTHRHTSITTAALMLGFEANTNALKWAEVFSQKYPALTVELEIDSEQSTQEDYRLLARFKGGIRQPNQQTLF